MKRASRIMPPTYFFVLLVLAVSLHTWLPLRQLTDSQYRHLGWALVVFGAVLNIWADQQFKRKKTTVKPHEKPSWLETKGPFRISRHPMYLGMLSILLGAAVVMGSISSFIPAIVFVFLMEGMFIPVEERSMEQAFGRKYREYRKKVRRWI